MTVEGNELHVAKNHVNKLPRAAALYDLPCPACGANEGNRTIDFIYSGADLERPDAPVIYMQGFGMRSRRRLSKIAAYVPDHAGPVTELRVSYIQSRSTNRSLVQSITECGLNSTCRRSLTPDWASQSLGASHPANPIAWTSAGADLSALTTEGTGQYLEPDHGVGVAHLGSGPETQLIVTDGTDWTGVIHRSAGDSWRLDSVTLGYRNRPIVLDYDHDGRDEIFTISAELAECGSWALPWQMCGRTEVHRNTIAIVDENAAVWDLLATSELDFQCAGGSALSFSAADFVGRGRSQLLRFCDSSARFLDSNGATTAGTWRDFSAATTSSMILDIDGDRLDDVLIVDDETNELYVQHGRVGPRSVFRRPAHARIGRQVGAAASSDVQTSPNNMSGRSIRSILIDAQERGSEREQWLNSLSRLPPPSSLYEKFRRRRGGFGTGARAREGSVSVGEAIWQYPQTAVGSVFAWHAFRNGATRVDQRGGVIEVFGGSPVGHSMAFGTFIIHPTGTPTKESRVHEAAHIPQSQALGPLYFPAHILGGVYSEGVFFLNGDTVSTPSSHQGPGSWHRYNPLEVGPAASSLGWSESRRTSPVPWPWTSPGLYPLRPVPK